MKRVKCKSGIMGWQAKLQSVYRDFEEFDSCCSSYNLHTRLGYKTSANAWRNNPTVTGSTIPSDYSRVFPKKKERCPKCNGGKSTKLRMKNA